MMEDLEQRKISYNGVENAYNQARPSYARVLIERAVELAQLPSDAIILEVGCGPGNATISFAQLGFSMVCLEPNQEFCHLARQKCASYPLIDIQNTSFEEWELETQKFNAVLAANAMHWVPPEVGYPKAASALQDNSFLMLLWNLTPQPFYTLYQALSEVFQKQALSVARYEDRGTQEEILKGFGQNIIASGQFKDLMSEQLVCEVSYSIEDYLTFLSTHYRKLDPQKQKSLFEGLRKTLEKNCGGSIKTSYLSAFQIAQKI